MKSVRVIIPTPYLAHDLRKFVEALRKIRLGSLYFHIFESRLKLGRGLNDFSIWLQDSLSETELGEEIAQLDPYTYTLVGRSNIEELRLIAAKLSGKVIQNINSTFTGGGMAEILSRMVPLLRQLGVDAR